MLKIDDHLSDLSVDIIESCSVDKPPAKKQKIFDAEKIFMGEELSDIEINYAQCLLKEKHPKINGLRTEEKFQKLRIVSRLYIVQQDTIG